MAQSKPRFGTKDINQIYHVWGGAGYPGGLCAQRAENEVPAVYGDKERVWKYSHYSDWLGRVREGSLERRTKVFN